MLCFQIQRTLVRVVCFYIMILVAVPLHAQERESGAQNGVVSSKILEAPPAIRAAKTLAAIEASPTPSSINRYADPVQGASSSDLVRRALSSNSDLAAARLDLERGRARLQQAGLRPNPTVDFEQISGRLTGSTGERETTIGFALPVELGGKRQRRIDLARAELEAAQAEIENRERRLVADVRSAYAEAMSALRELEITENLNELDVQTARIIEARVTEGESTPLESNLLKVEVDRMKARRSLVEGRLQGAMLKLKGLTGISPAEQLRLREDLATPVLPEPPTSVDAALEIALRMRPDLKLTRLMEEVAQAGLKLARAQSTPDLTAFSKYTNSNSVFDNTPIGVLSDRDNLLSFGVSLSIPVFNRNQGAKAEAEVAILQARKRREFVEAMVKTEVASAYARYQAANTAMDTLREGVLARSMQNIRSVRGAYEIGAFRVTDLLVEQRRYVDAQREFIEALTERYRALADFQAAIGAPAQ